METLNDLLHVELVITNYVNIFTPFRIVNSESNVTVTIIYADKVDISDEKKV